MKPFIDECGIIHIAYMATATFLSKEVVTTSGPLPVAIIRQLVHGTPISCAWIAVHGNRRRAGDSLLDPGSAWRRFGC